MTFDLNSYLAALRDERTRMNAPENCVHSWRHRATDDGTPLYLCALCNEQGFMVPDE